MNPRKALCFISSFGANDNLVFKAITKRHDCRELSLLRFSQGCQPADCVGLILDLDLSDSKSVALARAGLAKAGGSGSFVIATVNPAQKTDHAIAVSFNADKIVPVVQIEQKQGKDVPAGRLVTQIALTEVLLTVDWLLTKAALPPALLAAANAGESVVTEMLAQPRTGALMRQKMLAEKSWIITSGIAEHGLPSWLRMVARHHSPTFQHCMTVSGVANAFGQIIGLRARDLEQMTVSAMLHDIGKAHVPIEILDKPGPLNEEEWHNLREHPVIGSKMVENVDEYDPAVKDVIAHHHEYLDGTGYPHQLCNGEISDLTRLLTISDVFGALIERRSYKPEISPLQAYEIILAMNRQLDMPLVRAFKEVLR